MAPNSSTFSRKTRETDIRVEIVMEPGMPFFDHLLQAMAFHGRFGQALIPMDEALSEAVVDGRAGGCGAPGRGGMSTKGRIG